MGKSGVFNWRIPVQAVNLINQSFSKTLETHQKKSPYENNGSESTFALMMEEENSRRKNNAASEKPVSLNNEKKAGEKLSSKNYSKDEQKETSVEEKFVEAQNAGFLENESLIQENPSAENEIPEAETEKVEFFASLNNENSAEPLQFQTESNELKLTNETELSAEEINYLSEQKSRTDLDLIFENTAEYGIFDPSKEQLENARTLSVEEPKEFLQQAALYRHSEEETFPELKDLKEEISEEKVSFSVKSENSENKDLSYRIFSVTDNRSVEEKLKSLEESFEGKAEFKKQGSNSLEMTLNLSQQGTQNILASDSYGTVSSGSTFQQMLTQQLEYNAPEFVKMGNIVLENNKSGTIDMILKPESLGNVKLSLQVSDKVITGQITVATKEAMEAFKQSMDSLKQAFVQSGFEDVNLNVSLADYSQGGNFSQQQQSQAQQSLNQLYSDKTYSDYVVSPESETQTVQSFSMNNGYSIDVVA